MVISYWEMVASIVNRGLINDELFFESNGEIWVVWDRMRRCADLASGVQESAAVCEYRRNVQAAGSLAREACAGSSAAMRSMMAQTMTKMKTS